MHKYNYNLTNQIHDIKYNKDAHIFNKALILLPNIFQSYNNVFTLDFYQVNLLIQEYYLEYSLQTYEYITNKIKINILIYRKNNIYELKIEIMGLIDNLLIYFFSFIEPEFKINTIEKFIYKNAQDNISMHNGKLYKKKLNNKVCFYELNNARKPLEYYTKIYTKSIAHNKTLRCNLQYSKNKYYNKKHIKILENIFWESGKYYSNIYLIKYKYKYILKTKVKTNDIMDKSITEKYNINKLINNTVCNIFDIII